MVILSLIVVGVPSLCGLGLWAAASQLQNRTTEKMVLAAPSGSVDLDSVRVKLAKTVDNAGVERSDTAAIDDLARVVLSEGLQDVRVNTRSASKALRKALLAQ
jgi:hypothetical protein